MPFGLAMIAACVGESIPLIGVFISAILGTAISSGIKSLGNMLIVLAVYVFFVLFTKSKIAIEERNEEIKSGGKLFAASFLVYLVKSITGVFLIYDVFMGVISAGITYVFYKIFVNGLAVIKDVKKAFTVEELIAGAIIVGLASLALNQITIFSLSISNIIIILMIMILGWQNGTLIGAASGVALGLVTCIIDGTSLIQVLMFSISGILSGFLNKFGKIGVIIGFLLGNAILTYWVRGVTSVVIYFREIFIASLGLLLIPKKFKIKVEDVYGKDKLLDDKGDNRLEPAKESEVSQRLRTISNMFSNFITSQEEKEIRKINIEQEFLDNLEDINKNIFYDEIANKENGIAKDICSVLIKNDMLLDSDLIEILKEHNNYIYNQDEYIKNNLQEIVKIANKTLKVAQANTIKVEERKRNYEEFNNELKNVTKVIDKCADDIEKNVEKKFKEKEQEIKLLLEAKKINVINCSIKQIENMKYIIDLQLDYSDMKLREKNIMSGIAVIISKSIGTKIVLQRERIDDEKKEYKQVYSSEDKYILQVGSAKITKDNSNVSGDCSLQIKLADGKYLLAIADGTGTGAKAREYSKLTLRLMKQLLAAGFNREESIQLINTRINLIGDSEKFSTLDATILDLYAGKIEILKSGACPTYIRNKKNVYKIQSETMPLGSLTNPEVQNQTIDVEDGEILVMCSDGIVDSKDDFGIWLENYIKNINTNNVQKIADLILAEAIDNNYGIAKDDMTVIVSRVVKRK